MQRSHISQNVTSDEQEAQEPPSASPLSEDLAAIVDRVVAVAQRGSAEFKRTAESNPTLVLAGCVAAGALASLVIQRRHKPTVPQQLRRDIVRNTRNLRHALRQELRNSGIGDQYDQLSAQLSSSLSRFDWRPYIVPVVEKLLATADEVKTTLTKA